MLPVYRLIRCRFRIAIKSVPIVTFLAIIKDICNGQTQETLIESNQPLNEYQVTPADTSV